jgi:hypothetical protein
MSHPAVRMVAIVVLLSRSVAVATVTRAQGGPAAAIVSRAPRVSPLPGCRRSNRTFAITTYLPEAQDRSVGY